MSLFIDGPLTDEYFERMPAFTHLNGSSRPSFVRRRQLIDKWFACYPTEGKLSIQKRFQSKDDAKHHAAFFELIIYKVLREQGFQVELADLSKDSKLPDFLVTRPDGYQFWVEACTTSEEKSRGQKRLDQLHDYINRHVRSKDFILDLTVRSTGNTDLPCQLAARELKHVLNDASYDELVSLAGGKNEAARPAWRLIQGGWSIQISVWPKHKFRGRDDYNIIAVWGSAGDDKADDDIRLGRSIAKKANYYGDLDLPFVIAANSMSFYSEPETAVWALYGRDTFLMQKTGERFIPIPWRGDGTWLQRNRHWHKGRCSAVLYVSQATPLNVFSARACMFYHPFPCYEIETILPDLDQCRVDNGGFAYPERETCTKLGSVLPEADDLERNEDYPD